MPKEIILSSSQNPGRNETLAVIGWSQEAEYVQLATIARDPVTYDVRLVRPVTEATWIDNGGPAPVLVSSATAGVEFDGWYVDLDRRQINQLIRQLRRARDQAFGRDE